LAAINSKVFTLSNGGQGLRHISHGKINAIEMRKKRVPFPDLAAAEYQTRDSLPRKDAL
jgi:hypothetical protein